MFLKLMGQSGHNNGSSNAMAMLRPTAAAVIAIAALVGGGGTCTSYAFAPSPIRRGCTVRSQQLSSITSTRLRVSSTPNGVKPSSAPAKADFAAADFDPSLNPTEIDASNTPPSLQTILTSLAELKSGSDLRGTFAAHNSSGGTIANVSHLIRRLKEDTGAIALTPFAAHCFGAAFAQWLLQTDVPEEATGRPGRHGNALTICIGRDPRKHGERLADAFARGAESVDGERPVRAVYTGVATTPSMYEFVRADKCDAAVMVSASHLPEDKNGIKFFAREGGLTKTNIDELIVLAQEEARRWYDAGILPPSSGNAGVFCSELVDFMPFYQETLKRALVREVGEATSSPLSKPLAGLNIVVNPGNGAGCFFDDLLRELGANVAGSMHLTPDGTFPIEFGVPNPEKREMVEDTIKACEANSADIGVMFDTDADRAGFVLPRVVDKSGKRSQYEPLNKNRLIALLSVVFSSASPGCTIVTDSTTSEGLNEFLEEKLGLRHFRYLRGYANVIGKAKELTESGKANAEVAIETSGHCAMKENGYVDDGTYTAVKIIGLLARTAASGKGSSLLDLISDLNELPYEEEFRLQATDGSLETTTSLFNELSHSVLEECSAMEDWSIDEDNLEGQRVRLSSGGFFMIRQSLHDPVISMQIESVSAEEARDKVLTPLLNLVSKHDMLDYTAME
ncbi:hypothetical protein ACHAXT_012896 [Thalassiosira profunda]